jgi:hypothetical protein
MTEKQIFSNIVKILKKKGKKYKKRVGFWYCYDFDAGFTLVYDTFCGFMSLESNHQKFTETGYFGEKVKLEVFFGCQDCIEPATDYLSKINNKLKEE